MKKRARNVLIAAALASASSVAAAQDSVELRFAHWLPASHDIHPSLAEWAKSIEKASDGSIKLTLYPSQQLGAAKDHYALVRDGVVDFSFINPGYTPGQFPVIAGAELPFLFDNAVAGTRALDEWYRRHNRRDMKDVHFCMAMLHDPGTIHSKKPITSPEHIKGLKMRPANATLARFVNGLGGASVHIAIPETRDAIAKGVADAATMPWNGLFVWGLDGILKHHTDFSLYTTNFIIPMNKGSYQKLSAEQKKVIDSHCSSEWAQKVATKWAEREASGYQRVQKADGHQLHKPTPQEMKAWQEAAEPLRAAWAKDVSRTGQDPKAIYADLVETLRKHDSLYE